MAVRLLLKTILSLHIVCWAASGYAAALTPVTLSTGQTVMVEVQTMTVHIPKQCQPQYCESDDLDCDGILDQSCPGLEYDICVAGSVVDAYVQAAFTGQCVNEPQCGELVVSPAMPCED